MLAHLRGNLLLLVLTLPVCSVLYPLAVLAVGQGLFSAKASGSLVLGPDGKPVGSRLIAQEFRGDEWFRARPSAASYDARTSGGSNLSASNPRLRDRVARQLGPMVRYRPGARSSSVQQDIEAWFAARPDRLPAWVKACPTAAAAWLEDEGNKKAVAAWRAENPGDFFATFATRHPGTFPEVQNDAVRPARTGPAIQATFFAMWLQDNPDRARDIEPVPADAVTASGSGLDPHITLGNARGQMERVVAAWAGKTRGDAAEVRAVVEEVLAGAAFRPLGGLAGGEEIVNVLEVNLELARRLPVR